jgi:hypothetical protein
VSEIITEALEVKGWTSGARPERIRRGWTPAVSASYRLSLHDCNRLADSLRRFLPPASRI